jgi:hypothetical protein
MVNVIVLATAVEDVVVLLVLVEEFLADVEDTELETPGVAPAVKVTGMAPSTLRLEKEVIVVMEEMVEVELAMSNIVAVQAPLDELAMLQLKLIDSESPSWSTGWL